MYYYVVNPAAGDGKINKIQLKLQELIKKSGINGEFVKTTGKGDAARIVKMAIKERASTIVAVGGDSTVSEIVNSLGSQSEVVLGIIPIGKTNILANSLSIFDWQQSVKVLAKRNVKNITLGRVNDYYFITSLEIGFEEKFLKKRGETSVFKKVLLRKEIAEKLLAFKGFDARLDFDKDFSLETKIFNISVLGSKLIIDSNVRNKLSVFLVPFQSKMSLLGNIKKLVKGDYQDLPFISSFSAKNVFIDTYDKPQNVYADSSLIGTTPVEVSISDKSINVIVSKNLAKDIDLS